MRPDQLPVTVTCPRALDDHDAVGARGIIDAVEGDEAALGGHIEVVGACGQGELDVSGGGRRHQEAGGPAKDSPIWPASPTTSSTSVWSPFRPGLPGGRRRGAR